MKKTTTKKANYGGTKSMMRSGGKTKMANKPKMAGGGKVASKKKYAMAGTTENDPPKERCTPDNPNCGKRDLRPKGTTTPKPGIGQRIKNALSPGRIKTRRV